MKFLDEKYFETANKNREECRKQALVQRNYLTNESTAKYHGRAVYTMFMPKLFSEKETEKFKSIVEMSNRIFNKVIKRYCENAEFRKAFGFSKELEELILLDNGYENVIPVSRIDIFFNEDEKSSDYMNFKFCEINTDGSSAMNEDRELVTAVKKTGVFNEFEKEYELKSFELFDSLVDEFLKIYETYGKKVENPNIVITDFTENATSEEFKQFKKAFERKNLNCEIVDIRDFEYQNGVLKTPNKMKVDLVYRRAVTADIMKNYDFIQPFLNAVKDGAVCLMGSFRTQVVHTKTLFEVLCNTKLTSLFLEKDELEFIENHIPKTFELSRENKLINIDEIKKERKKWIVKPTDSYGSKNVLSGVECENDEEWAEFIDNCLELDDKYIVQEFITPYRSKNLDFIDGNGFEDIKEYFNLTGLFSYGGKFSGVYSRVAQNEVISTVYSEIALPSFCVSERKNSI